MIMFMTDGDCYTNTKDWLEKIKSEFGSKIKKF